MQCQYMALNVASVQIVWCMWSCDYIAAEAHNVYKRAQHQTDSSSARQPTVCMSQDLQTSFFILGGKIQFIGVIGKAFSMNNAFIVTNSVRTVRITFKNLHDELGLVTINRELCNVSIRPRGPLNQTPMESCTRDITNAAGPLLPNEQMNRRDRIHEEHVSPFWIFGQLHVESQDKNLCNGQGP